jgi:glycerol-3-phosphate acyltransferase PlsY
MGLGSGMIIPLFLRWYWWRFNGYGFAAGTIAGSIAAYAAVLLLPGATEWITFSVVSITSLIAAILVALFTRQTPDSVLINFYSVTKPFGIWEPVRRKCTGIDLAEVKTENKRDIVATAITIIWQLSLFITMMMLILKEWNTFIITAMICVISSILLYRRWYRYLRVDK